MNQMRFYDMVEEAEGLARLACPSADDISRACELLQDVHVTYWFFAEALKQNNPAWLPVLDDQGYFRRFPEPDKEGHAWIWFAGEYVRQFAAVHPNRVVTIIKRATTRNTSVYEALADAAASLPADHRPHVAKTLAAWLGKPSLWLSEKVANVMGKLAAEGRFSEAALILRALLRVKETGRDPMLGVFVNFALPVHEFADHLRSVLKDIARTNPLFVVSELQKILLDVLGQRRGERGRRGDLSYIWRQTIEGEAHLGPGPKDVLVSGIRDAIVVGVENSPATMRPILERYVDGRGLPYVLTRVALYVLARNSDRYWDLVQTALQRRGWVRGPSLAHDYRQLLTTTFEALLECSPTLAQRILRRIDQLPRDRQPDWLEALAGFLSPARKRRLHNIRKEQARQMAAARPEREAAFPNLASLSVREVALKLGDDYVEGPGAEAFQGDVRKRPAEYSGQLAKFLPGSVPARYIASLLDALGDATRDGATLDWSGVLEYCRSLVNTPADDMALSSPHGYAPPLDWFLTATARLVTTALQKEAVTQLDAIKQLLLETMRRAGELEQRPEAAEPDTEAPWASAFSDARAQTLSALIELARRIALVSHPELTGWPDGPILDPDVRDGLDRQLARGDSLGLAERAVLGQYLPVLAWLDMPWLSAHLDAVLPQSPDRIESWWAAWGAYLFFNPYYEKVMQAVRAHYTLALERVADPHRPSWADASDEGLVMHIMNAMCLGDEPHDDSRSLSALFFAKAPAELRGSAIRTLGRWLKESVFPDPEQLRMPLKGLWLQRVRAAEEGEDPSAFAVELAEFSWWLHADFAPPGELQDLMSRTIPHLHGQGGGRFLIEYCGRHAQDQPASLLLLNELFRLPRPFWILYHKDAVRKVLEAASESGDPDMLAAVDYTVNRLGELGQRDFRDLLPSRQRSS